jgi:hypothetical protein
MAIAKRHLALLAAIAAAVAAVALLAAVGPARIVGAVGVENTYLVAFLLAAIGGLSSFTGVSVLAAIAAFASGGANPLWLGLSAGVGIFLSDSVFFLLASYGRELARGSWQRGVDTFAAWARRLPDWAVASGTYVYISFTPLPNDALMLALAAAGYRYRQIAPVLLLGGVTLAVLLAYLARAGWALL